MALRALLRGRLWRNSPAGTSRTNRLPGKKVSSDFVKFATPTEIPSTGTGLLLSNNVESAKTMTVFADSISTPATGSISCRQPNPLC